MLPKLPLIYIIPPGLSIIVGITLTIISVAKGKLKSENILFALVCLWSTLIPPIFISHYLLTGEKEITTFARFINFFYVYLPVIYLLFIHNILDIKRNYLIIISVILSFLLSISTFTNYYIHGLYVYNWGYISKGGIAFRIFGIYGFAVLVYMVYCLFDNLKHETDPRKRMSHSYMILSFVLSGVLTILNLPAINGINFYPAGNFNFIPLSILAYGVLRYRLLDIKSFIHITTVRVLSIVVILLPNWIIYHYARPYFLKADSGLLFFLFVMWFLANHFYITMVQTKIDDRFYRIKYRLKLAEMEFNEAIDTIRDYNDLVEKIRLTLRETLNFSSVTVFKRISRYGPLIGPLGYQFKIGSNIEKMLSQAGRFIDRQAIETDPQYAGISEHLLKAFDLLKTSYMIPFFQNQSLFALFFLSGSSYVQISREEIDFTNKILASASEKLPSLEER